MYSLLLVPELEAPASQSTLTFDFWSEFDHHKLLFFAGRDRVLGIGADNNVEFKEKEANNIEQQWTRSNDFSDGKSTTYIEQTTSNQSIAKIKHLVIFLFDAWNINHSIFQSNCGQLKKTQMRLISWITKNMKNVGNIIQQDGVFQDFVTNLIVSKQVILKIAWGQESSKRIAGGPKLATLPWCLILLDLCCRSWPKCSVGLGN